MHFESIAYVGAAFRNLRELFSFHKTLISCVNKSTRKKIHAISNVHKMFPAESSGKPLPWM